METIPLLEYALDAARRKGDAFLIYLVGMALAEARYLEAGIREEGPKEPQTVH